MKRRMWIWREHGKMGEDWDWQSRSLKIPSPGRGRDMLFVDVMREYVWRGEQK